MNRHLVDPEMGKNKEMDEDNKIKTGGKEGTNTTK